MSKFLDKDGLQYFYTKLKAYADTHANVLWTYDNVEDMKDASNLIAGSFAKVNNHSGSDKNYGNYKIREAEVGETPDNFHTVLLDNGLIAELVESSNYLPLTVSHVRYSGSKNKTDVWYSIVPKDYAPELFLANGIVDSVEDASQNSMENKLTLAINGGIFNTSNNQTTGIVICNSELYKYNDSGTAGRYIVYCKQDGTLDCVASTATTAEVQALNPVWAIRAFWPIYKDGEDVTSGRDPEDYQPRTFIGQDAEGNYIVGVCAGRSYLQQGLNAYDVKNFVLSVGFTPYFLFNLDGGGSSSMTYHGERINNLVNYENREVANFIGFRDKNACLKDSFNTALSSSTVTSSIRADLQSYNISDRLTADADSVTNYGLSLRPSSHIAITGEMVTLNLYFTNTSEIPHYGELLKGLPASRGGQRLNFILHGHTSAAATTLVTRQVYLTEYGELRNDNQGAIPAGEWYVNASYITIRNITPDRPEV